LEQLGCTLGYRVAVLASRTVIRDGSAKRCMNPIRELLLALYCCPLSPE
jgi:hypothetical protein